MLVDQFGRSVPVKTKVQKTQTIDIRKLLDATERAKEQLKVERFKEGRE